MVRCRAPGKPAKLAGSGRKRVRGFTTDTTHLEDNESIRLSKEICYGLTVFRVICGWEDESQNFLFHGFSPHEIRFATDKCRIRRRQVEDEHRARGVLLAPFTVGNNRTPLLPMSSLVTGSQNSFTDEQNSQATISVKKKINHAPKVSPNQIVKKKTLKNLLQRTIKCKVKTSGISNDGSETKNRAIARKFVLPIRSAHSSRVIKPNKRFRDIDTHSICYDSSEGQSIKKPRLTIDTDDDSSTSGVGKRTGEQSDSESVSGWSSSVSTTGSSVQDEYLPPSVKGKVILRKAKLKVEPDPPAIKGPFSSEFQDVHNTRRKNEKIKGRSLVPQEIVCGVCGAVRYYRHIKQTRKFGIHCCETCRKFISRVIANVSDSYGTFTCKSESGGCELLPYIRHPDTGHIQNSRCKACWLNICLHNFCMPNYLTESLMLKLPSFMQNISIETKPKNSSDQKERIKLMHRSRNRQLNTMIVPNQLNGKQLMAKNIRRRAEEIAARNGRKLKSEICNNVLTKKKISNIKLKPVLAKKLSRKNDLCSVQGKMKDTAKGKMTTHSNLKLKKMKKEKVVKEDKLTRIQRKREEKLIKLQKLKGPRVKHVCRSASLVLGQPVATFTDTSPSKQKQPHSGRVTEDDNLELSSSRTFRDESANGASGKLSDPNSKIRQPSNHDSDNLLTGKNKPAVSEQMASCDSTSEGLDGKARTLQDLTRQHYELINGETVGENLGLIAINFLEDYDSQEVCRTGFALTGFGDCFVPRGVCFLCGSAGLEKLIHCASCCEPYHRYCLEGVDRVGKEEESWLVDWVCPQCTLCHGCGRVGDTQVACQKCHNSYHTECIAADRVASRLHSSDRPWVCLSCLVCKSCNQPEVHKFVGNLPLCRVCFKLRQKGNFCPLCQRCYDDNDFDSKVKVKMMECERCKCWVHAKCEGLSNEQYHILSILPENVAFVCRLCCKMPPAPWWTAVELEMKARFLDVLKFLSKNRKACDLLKWSPTKMPYPVCTCGSGLRQRGLRFPDLLEQSDIESLDMKLQSGVQKEESVKSEEECLKGLPNFSTVNTESLVCDPKIENSDKQLALCEMRTKYNMRECTGLKSDELQLKLDSDAISYQNTDEKPSQFSPHATSQSDSGIGSTDDELKSTNDQCVCLELESCNKTPPSLLTIKKKVNSNEYDSLDSFNKEMEEIINSIQNQELLKIYHQTLKDIFPWFNPEYCEVLDPVTRISHNSHTTEPIKLASDKKCNEGDIDDVTITLKGKLDLSSDYYYIVDKSTDTRTCIFCKQMGEGQPTEEGRLLYCGQNEWVHTNCVLWSNEVFEEDDGTLQNVQSAISRSRLIRCSTCSKKGASIGCCNRTCPGVYHFNCARVSCVFYENKLLFCSNHKDDSVSSRPLVTGSDFLVSRPVFVERKKQKYVAKPDIHVTIGSLTIISLGDFDPDLSDQECSIIPCNFQCSRLFWSPIEPWRLVEYSIKTKIVYTIADSAEDHENNITIDHSPDEYDFCNDSEGNLEENIDESEVKETLDLVLDTVCTKEEEDPQASADLLPPELKEAIFEDLPRDLLDGISMQDIFSKLMNGDSSALDFKTDKEYKIISKTNSSTHNYEKIKNNTSNFSNIFESKVIVNSSDISKMIDFQSNHVLKKKIKSFNEDSKKFIKSEEKENSKKWSLSKILQIDGAGDCDSDSDSSMSEESRSPSPIKRSFNYHQLINSCNCLHVESNISSNSSECSSPESDYEELWKLDQLDGATDFSCGKDNKILDEDPVKCTRCHRTYRTAQSLERHLLTCNVDFLSGSDSDSTEEDKASSPEVNSEDVDYVNSNSNFISPEIKSETTVSSVLPNLQYQVSSFDENKSNIEINASLQSCELSSSYNKVMNYPSNNKMIQTPSQSSLSASTNAVLSPPHCNNLDLNKPVNQHTYPPKPKTIRASFECENSVTPISSMDGRTSPVRIRPVKTYSRKKKECTSLATSVSAVSLAQQKAMELQMCSTPPALIIQQVPTHNVVPSYIESIPAQSNNNIQYQYITTLDMQEKPQQIPLAVQIQSPISIQPVLGPTVLGTLIQPNGVEQLVVNTPVSTVEVLNQQPTNVYITSMNQPTVYMGMETVISNTVMSTSQIVSGMITGSSYSATTTQVFQTAKPVIDMPQSYVVVNAQANSVPNTISENVYSSSNSQPWTYNYQETYKVKERTTYQQVTRQIIHEENNLDCVKMLDPTQEAIFIDKPIVKEVTVEKTHSIHKTGSVPGLSDTFNHVNPLLINGHLDTAQCRNEKQVFNNTAHLHNWQQEITKAEHDKNQSQNQETKINRSLANIAISAIKNEPLIQNSDKSEKIFPIVKSSNKIENCNVQKAIIKPVIRKVQKPNMNVNAKQCSPIFEPSSLIERQHTPIIKDNLTNEHSNPLPKQTGKCLNNKPIKQETIKVDYQKKPNDKRIPLKENKVVGNKSKPCKNNNKKSNTVAHPKLMYEITSQDGLSICSQDVVEAWQKIFEAVQTARSEKRLPPLPQCPQKSQLRLLGLDNNCVKNLLEQLPGVKSCNNYKPVYHKTKLFGHSEQLRENPTGCARTEPISNQRRKYDMFSWLASRHRRPPKLIINSETEIVNGISRRATSLNLPMAMRFRHLKESSKESVGVFRSDIHGRGLFCLRDIDSGEMVIEYAGEVIRAGLTDKREHYYTAKGIGCYMFRIDDHFVVDATMHGNAARFINHSCEPNCFSRVVDVLGKKHILIFALRKIAQGEELTYDYKFPLEDDKISCHCLSRKCRKYLN